MVRMVTVSKSKLKNKNKKKKKKKNLPEEEIIRRNQRKMKSEDRVEKEGKYYFFK
jgi:hypothetical protein